MPIIYINESNEIDKEKTSRSEILSGIIRAYNKFTKDYYQQYKDMTIAQRFRLTQKQRDTYDAIGDSKLIPTNKGDFLNGNTDELVFKLGSKIGAFMFPLLLTDIFGIILGATAIVAGNSTKSLSSKEGDISDYIKNEIKHDVDVSNKDRRIHVKVNDL